MPFTKEQLNDQDFIRQNRVINTITKMKKNLIRHIHFNPNDKEKVFTLTFDLGQDLLIEKIVEMATQEFVNMVVEHSVTIRYRSSFNREVMILTLRLNWRIEDVLNQAFIVYDSSSSSEDDYQS